MAGTISAIRAMDELAVSGKTVILRLDINSPLDPKTKKIVSENRIKKSLPTLRQLLERGAKLAILAHQGDTLDYHNLIPLTEHAQKLSALLGQEVRYIDDVCGPAAQEAVRNLKAGEAVLLGNLRYLSEEISTFEDAVKLKPSEMLDTYLVRSLAPLADFYVNDAFAAAHRNAPSMVAFQELLPSAGGLLLMDEIRALATVMENPARPNVFVLGGLKISDAFGMMEQVLENGSADKILTCGVTGQIMLMAAGYDLGAKNAEFIQARSLDVFIKPAQDYLARHRDKIVYPLDLAYEQAGKRAEIMLSALPADELYLDIGQQTIEKFRAELTGAGTIFVNGPAGVYENPLFENGTKNIWTAIAEAKGYSVIGGGDTVSAAQKFIDTGKINYVCTAGGAMVRFLSGDRLPLLAAMQKGGTKRGDDHAE